MQYARNEARSGVLSIGSRPKSSPYLPSLGIPLIYRKPRRYIHLTVSYRLPPFPYQGPSRRKPTEAKAEAAGMGAPSHTVQKEARERGLRVGKNDA